VNDIVLKAALWIALGWIAYTYALYPLIIALLVRKSPLKTSPAFSGTISIVIAACNEERAIGPRVEELLRLVTVSGLTGEIIVVSDGSIDGTVTQANPTLDPRVQVISLPMNVGKAAALSRGCAAAKGDVLVFADVRQRWNPETLPNLLRNFSRPTVGGASGELMIEDPSGKLSGVGLYWRYEKWIRRNEGRIHSTVGVTGSVCAVRRHLFSPIPERTLLDDVYWPMQVVMHGHRVVHDSSALAFDRLPPNAKDEFRRKVRTLSGNFQLCARLPQALLPWRNPIWIQFISHKIMRLFVPWALLIVLFCSLLLSGWLYSLILYSQLILYCAGLAGLTRGTILHTRITAALAAFLILNAAAWLAFWVWCTGRCESSWSKVKYLRNTPA
jgi:biofilm PGA synthesis N-glycosyltransferase PgaC